MRRCGRLRDLKRKDRVCEREREREVVREKEGRRDRVTSGGNSR